MCVVGKWGFGKYSIYDELMMMMTRLIVSFWVLIIEFGGATATLLILGYHFKKKIGIYI